MNAFFEKMKKQFEADTASGYIPLLVTYTKEDAEINGLRKAKKTDTVDREAEYFSAVEALGRSKRVMFLGEKGMGKSSLLKMIALCMVGEQCGDMKYSLAKLTEPISRTNSCKAPEAQAWTAGVLYTAWVDIADYPEGNLPADIRDAQLILLDGVEYATLEGWKSITKELDEIVAANPDVHIAAACEANVINRLRPRLQGFTNYTINTLINPQKKQIAEKCGQTDIEIPAALANVLNKTQDYILWMQNGRAANTPYDYFRSICGVDASYAAKSAFDLLTGDVKVADITSQVNAFSHSDSLIKYLACLYCLRNNFSENFGDLIDNLHYESWSALNTLKLIINENDPEPYIPNIISLCPETEPNEENAVKALFSAELAFGIRERVEGNAAYMANLKKWMKAIVCNAWLSVYDRIEAGKRLSWLGDDRELDAMVEIPAGDFTMGDYLIANNQPVEKIHVDAFKMGVYPVTNARYAEFVAETGTPWLSNEGGNIERRSYPAINLTWYEAVKFCDWLTEKWRKAGRIGKNEFVRLPTEAEWEYAARGKRASEEGKMIFPWGNEFVDDIANSAELGLNDTCPVGIFPGNVSDFGTRDMIGMVWEWNTTNWGNDPKHPAFPYPYNANDGRENSRHAADDVRRVMRGGSFGSTADHATASYRGHLEPIGFWRGDGFRIVVSEKSHD